MLISPAYAQDAAGGGGLLVQILPLILIFGVFYFLLIRPQRLQAKRHEALLKSLKPGDKVVTSSGIVGTVVSVKEATVFIRSADTKLELAKSAVSKITERSGGSEES